MAKARANRGSKQSSTPLRPAAKPSASPCGCAAGAITVNGTKPCPAETGRHAVGVDASLRRANLMHLRRIEGQVRGIATMIEDDRYCADIITQVSAVRESLHAVARNLLRNHLTFCAAAAMQGDAAQRDDMIEELLNMVGKLSR